MFPIQPCRAVDLPWNHDVTNTDCHPHKALGTSLATVSGFASLSLLALLSFHLGPWHHSVFFISQAHSFCLSDHHFHFNCIYILVASNCVCRPCEVDFRSFHPWTTHFARRTLIDHQTTSINTT